MDFFFFIKVKIKMVCFSVPSSDVQKGENVVVEIPVQAGEKKFQYEQKVKIVNPKLYGRGYAIGDMGHTDYVLVADDIVAVEEK
jgi:threonine dehydrogenase-like Zn-dependent dehydrogenase